MTSDLDNEKQKMPSMRDVKFTAAERKKLLIIGAVILMAFAIAVFISESLAASAMLAKLPDKCGMNDTSQGIENCLVSYANKTDNASVCFYVQGSQSYDCVIGLALKTENVSMCGILGSSYSYYTNCIQELNKKLNSMALCGYLPSTVLAQSCIYNVSASYNFTRPDLCSELSNKSYSSECYNIAYYRSALASGESSYCAYLSSSANESILRFLLYNSSAGLDEYQGNTTLYSYMNISPQTFCYTTLAVSQRNPTLCNYASASFSTVCSEIVQAANVSSMMIDYNATNVTDACENYSGYDLNYCNLEYTISNAIKINNITPCSTLNSSINRDQCVFTVAVNRSNENYCSGVSNGTTQSLCYLTINLTKK